LTGDVLSPRWSTDDTDEQPAIQVSGNETYILPPAQGVSADGEPYLTTGEPIYLDSQGGYIKDEAGSPYLVDGQADALYTGDAPSGAHYSADAAGGALYTTDAASDALYAGDSPSGAHYLGDSPSGAHYVGDSPSGAHYVGDSPSGAHYTGDAPSGPLYTGDSPSGAHRLDEAGEVAYLPLDKSYESSYGDDDDRPKRGFLGSGWTENPDDGHGRSDQEVRRRTRLLLVAAAAVVLLGGGAGWMLTSTSSDDPCAGGRCATVGELKPPAATPNDEMDVPIEEAEDTATSEPTASATRPATEAPARVRPTRTATQTREPATTRSPRATAKPTSRATRAPENDAPLQDFTPETTKPQPKDRKTESSLENKPADQPTMAPSTPDLAPQPQETSKGLLDILFPWA
jgi:hypothetical protein